MSTATSLRRRKSTCRSTSLACDAACVSLFWQFSTKWCCPASAFCRRSTIFAASTEVRAVRRNFDVLWLDSDPRLRCRDGWTSPKVFGPEFLHRRRFLSTTNCRRKKILFSEELPVWSSKRSSKRTGVWPETNFLQFNNASLWQVLYCFRYIS